MPRIRKNYAPSLKPKVAMEAINGSKTAAQIAQTFSVPPNLVTNWKKQAMAQLAQTQDLTLWGQSGCFPPHPTRTCN